jgi:hypothetical protein
MNTMKKAELVEYLIHEDAVALHMMERNREDSGKKLLDPETPEEWFFYWQGIRGAYQNVAHRISE